MSDAGGVRLLAARPALAIWVGGEAVSTLGTAIGNVALPLLVFTTTGSPALTGVLTALRVVPYLALGLVAGPIADRYSRRRLMVLATAAEGVALLSLPVVGSVTGVITVPHLYVVTLIGAACFVLGDAAAFGALPDLVSDDELPAANGVFATVGSTMLVVGPAVAGVLIGIIGAMAVLWVTAAGYFVATAALWSIRRSFADQVVDTDRSITEHIGAAIRFMLREPVLRVLLVVGFGNAVAAGAVLGQLIVYGAEVLGFDATDPRHGVLFTAGAVGSLIAGVIFSRLYRPVRFNRVVPAMLALAAIGAAGLSFGVHIWVAAAFYAALSLGSQWVIIAGITYRQAVSPPTIRATVNVVGRMVAWGGQPLGAVLGGVLAEVAGVRWMTGATAVLFVTLAAAAAVLIVPERVASAR